MLEGKCNHRMDNLIWTLTNRVIPYYRAKHHCQQFGFEGPNLELQWQKNIEATSHFIKIDNVEEVIQGSHYTVRSQLHPDKHYNVNMDSYTCNCKYFPSSHTANILQPYNCCFLKMWMCGHSHPSQSNPTRNRQWAPLVTLSQWNPQATMMTSVLQQWVVYPINYNNYQYALAWHHHSHAHHHSCAWSHCWILFSSKPPPHLSTSSPKQNILHWINTHGLKQLQ